jgi:hypothetical protein
MKNELERLSTPVFLPYILMLCTGRMGNIASTFYKRLASIIGEKKDIPYSQMLYLIRSKVSFALLRSSIMCIHGARSRSGQSSVEPYSLQIAESHI